MMHLFRIIPAWNPATKLRYSNTATRFPSRNNENPCKKRDSMRFSFAGAGRQVRACAHAPPQACRAQVVTGVQSPVYEVIIPNKKNRSETPK